MVAWATGHSDTKCAKLSAQRGYSSIWGGMSALFSVIFLILERDGGYFPPTELIHLPEAGACASLCSLPVLTGWRCRSWYRSGFSRMFLLLLAVPRETNSVPMVLPSLTSESLTFKTQQFPEKTHDISSPRDSRICTSTVAGTDLGAKHQSRTFLHFFSIPW